MEILFEFEKPIVSLEKKLTELRELSKSGQVDFSEEIALLEKKLKKIVEETYSKLTSWQRVQLSRHPGRLYTLDYFEALFPEFIELHGDRTYSDDAALVVGTAFWPPPQIPTPQEKRFPILLVGHQKGRGTKQKVERNFGMARPEGYRKAMRMFELAERFRLPVLTFIDTPGAYPGMDAEERGQSQAIAESIRKMFELTVPVGAIVIGEGGSGGALAIGVGNFVLMQEYSTYSVISPESCASILWSDSSLAERAAERLKMTSADLAQMSLVDAVIPEPFGGCHRAPQASIRELARCIDEQLKPLMKTDFSDPTSAGAQSLKEARFEKFRNLGSFAMDQG
jgi:acetyl-CoA carboxylase carboxyl transferase subunit alpha